MGSGALVMVLDKFGKVFGKAAKGLSGELEVIRWPEHLNPREYVAWRYPKTEIKWGSVVIVDESQKALFIRDGKILGVLDSGRYVLDTQNVPFLRGFVREVYGGESIFKASIVFVNLLRYKGQIGTRMFVDYIGVHLLINASYYFSVDETRLETFYTKVMGINEQVTVEDVDDLIRSYILDRLKESIAEYATQQAQQGRIIQNVADFEAMRTEIRTTLQASLADEIAREYGIRLENFRIENLDIPPEDKRILQMSGPRAFAAMYERDWTGREKIAESLSNSQGTAGVVAPFMMFPWMMYPPMPPQQPPQPPMTAPRPPGPPGPGGPQPPGQPGYPPGGPGYPPGAPQQGQPPQRPPAPGYPYPQQPYPAYPGYPYPAPYPYPYPAQQPPQGLPGQPPARQAAPGQAPAPQAQQPPAPGPAPQGAPQAGFAPAVQPHPAPQVQRPRCPHCGREIPPFSPVCPYCAQPIQWCPDGRQVKPGEPC